jgi:Domain of Unknown Function with PDB structure (DUF3857)
MFVRKRGDMTRFTTAALCISLFIVTAGFASLPTARSADDWQPIDPADLALKDNPKSPGADAMILYRESMVDARMSSNIEYIRVKIFTQAGTKNADVEIPFVKGLDDIKDVRARTIRPDGTVANFVGKPFDKTVVKVSGLKYLAKSFTLPDVQPGCIIEYKYRDQSDPNLFFNNEWTVQGDLFTRMARFAIKPTDGPPVYYRSVHLASNITPQKQPNGWYALEIHDLPGIEEEDFMPPEKSLRARVEFYYRNAADPEKETTEAYWKRTGKSWNETIDRYVDKKGVLTAEVSRTLPAGDSPETKLQKLYARAQQIRNLSMEESKSDKEERAEKLKLNLNAEDVLKHGYGNSREINYTYIGLLRAAGFDAEALFVAPRSGDVFRPEMRDTQQLSADLVWVHTGTKDYFLDPGARFYPFGYLPWFESSAWGIRITKDGATITQTPDLHSTECIITRTADLTLDDDGAVSGKLQVDFVGEAGAMRRHDNRNEDEPGRKKSLEDEIKGWLPSGSTFEITTLTSWDAIDQPLHIEGTVKIPGIGTTAGHRILLPAEIFETRYAKSFQSEKPRVNPIWFNYASEESDVLRLRVPLGYKPDSIPQPASLKPGPVSYEISVQGATDQVEVKRHLVIDGTSFAPSAYPAFRKFFGSVKTNDEAQIVLQTTASAKNN